MSEIKESFSNSKDCNKFNNSKDCNRFEVEKKLIDLYRYPSARDEVVSDFILKMLESIVESWEGYPCIEKSKISKPLANVKNLEMKSFDEKSERKTDENVEQDSIHSSYLTKEEKIPVTSDREEKSFSVEKDTSSQQDSKVDTKIEDKERMWIGEAYGDINQPIENWKLYKEDQIAIIEFRNGNIYKGRVSRHLMHGDGEFIWATGTLYKGSFQCGEMTGRGVIAWPSQAWYQGEIEKGFRHGCGLLVVPRRLAFYGMWSHGIRNGPGLLHFESNAANYYDVDWDDGKCSGKGVRVYPSGAKYSGHWKDGERNGFGVASWTNGDVYKGDWKDGKMHGLGQYIWSLAASNEFLFPLRNSYYGTWVEGQRHGIGILENDLGMTLRCEWNKDLKHGYGEIVCRNGFLLKGNTLFSKDHLLDPALNRRHASITTKSCPLSHYHANNELKKYGKPNIPTHLPSESIDLCYYVDRYYLNKWTLEKYEYNKKQDVDNVRKFLTSEGKKLSSKLLPSNLLPNKDFEGCFEEKWLRKIILRNLSFLRKIYHVYATIFCKNISNRSRPEMILIRLFLWQFFRDCKLQLKEKSLSNIDALVEKNPFALIKDRRNPFERLYFFQFLHYLLEVAWQTYGKFGDRYPRTPGSLASALEKLIYVDIKPNFGSHTGLLLKDSKNLCYLREIFGLYQSFKSDSTAALLLRTILEWESNAFLKRIQEMSSEMKKEGLIDDDDNTDRLKESHCSAKNVERPSKLKSEPHPVTYFAYLGDINLRLAMRCIRQICPRIKIDNSFLNLGYKITFLEMYEILLLCATKCFEKREKQLRKEKQKIPKSKSIDSKERKRSGYKKTTKESTSHFIKKN